MVQTARVPEGAGSVISHSGSARAAKDSPTRGSSDALRIAGMTALSTVDWPGKLAATLFLQGCPWDCFFCHNPELISPRTEGRVAWSSVVEFARRRQGLLDGFVFSGGEPTMQRGLGAAMAELRDMGFAIGLHTCGAFPRLLAPVLPLVDWVGLDIKACRADYADVTGRARSDAAAWRSLELVLAEAERRPFDYEVRTTVHPGVMDAEYLRVLSQQLAAAGVVNYAIQDFRGEGARDTMPDRGILSGVKMSSGEGAGADISLIDTSAFAHFEHRVH